jgi:hypothetical protein
MDDDWFLAENVERFYAAETFLQKMKEASMTVMRRPTQ